MLIVSRKPGQRIMIGDDIVILLSKIQGKKAVIGITAPKELGVYREEIYNKIKEEESKQTTFPDEVYK